MPAGPSVSGEPVGACSGALSPYTMESAVAAAAVSTDTRPPYSTRDNRSRPRVSVPSGWADGVITWFTSIFQGLPSTSVMIALAAILDPGVSSLLLALVLTSWASFSRVVRSSVLRLREEAYVEGARCLGAGRLRIITRYLLPNLLPEIAVLFTTRVGGVVLSVASLSFLGLGIQPPTPDWGVMISEARTSFRTAPMLILAPGACLIILSFGINYLGEMLRAHFDIRGRTRQID